MTTKTDVPLLVEESEWRLEDGLGGYSWGTSSGISTRRGQAFLATARDGRTYVLVNGFEVWVTTPAGRFAISSHRFAPDHVHPDGAWRIQEFTTRPWPRWRYRLDDGTHVIQEITAVPGHALAAIRWSLTEPAKGCSIEIRPFLSGRETAALHKENSSFRWPAEVRGWRVTWRPYDGVPDISMVANARYSADPHWYHNFLYLADGGAEDLASPGVFRAPLAWGTPVEIVMAAGWDAVIEGMILPDKPVLWADPDAPKGVPAPPVPATPPGKVPAKRRRRPPAARKTKPKKAPPKRAVAKKRTPSVRKDKTARRGKGGRPRRKKGRR